MTEFVRATVYRMDIACPEIVMISDTLDRIFDLYKNEFDLAFLHNPSYSWANKNVKQIRIKRPDGNNATIVIRGSKLTPKSAKGFSPNLVVMDEAGLCHPDTMMEAVIPSTDKSKGTIFVTGTVEDNWFHEFYIKARKKMAEGSKNWFCFSFKHGDKWSKGVHSSQRLADIKDKYSFEIEEDKRRFEKEQMCNWFAAGTGKIYRKYMYKAHMDQRVNVVPRLIHQNIGLSWDDGLGCTAVWFWQYHNKVLRLLRYQEWRTSSIYDITGDVLRYLDELQTSIGCMVVPFTMLNQLQTEQGLQTLLYKYCQLLHYNGKIIEIPKVANKSTKYEAMYTLLQVAMFDEVNCSDGLRHVSNYSLDATRREAAEFSHAADALSELAMAYTNGLLDEEAVRSGLEIRKDPQGFIDKMPMFFGEKRSKKSVLGPY